MRILSDLSIFKKQQASIFEHKDTTVLSDRGQRGTYIIHIPKEKIPPNTNIFTSFFTKINSTESYFQRRKNPNFLSIEYVVSGEHYVSWGNSGIVAEAGDIVLLHPYMEHDLLYTSDIPCVKYGMCIYGEKLIPIIKALELDMCYYFYVNDAQLLIKSIENLQTLFSEGNHLDFNKNAGATFELLNTISQLKPNNPTQADVDLVIQFFQKNLDQKINLDQVANLIGKSLSSLTKLFLEKTHITPYQYLRNMRMQHAHELLKTQKYSVKEVCAMTGYASPPCFSAEFKKFFGKAPSQIFK